MRYFVLFILLSHCGWAHTQASSSLQATWVHFDKPFYLTEDVLGFQLYLAPEFAGENITVQAILFDPNGQAVNYSYWQNNGRAVISGSTQLAAELSTDWYYLSFRAWDREKGRERVLLQAPVAIYDAQQEIVTARVSQQEPPRLKAPVETATRKALNIQLVDVQERVSAGAPVRIVLDIRDHRGRPVGADYSLSVSDWSLLSCSLALGMDNLHASDSLRVVVPRFLGNDLYWQGVLLNDAKEEVADERIQVQLGANTQTITTDERGAYLLRTPERVLHSELHVTYPNGQMATTQFRPARGRLVLGELFYTPAVFRYLELHRQRQQINQVLGNTPAPLTYRQANTVELIPGKASFSGYTTDQNHGWLPTATTKGPANPSLVWQSGIQTDREGGAVIEFTPSSERTAYRIDIVAQDAKGQRGRTSVLYRAE
ncbi:MAG: hypothetical protein AAGJ82_00030 [Bacteroidota bacterium]